MRCQVKQGVSMCYKYAAAQGTRYLALVANIHKAGAGAVHSLNIQTFHSLEIYFYWNFWRKCVLFDFGPASCILLKLWISAQHKCPRPRWWIASHPVANIYLGKTSGSFSIGKYLCKKAKRYFILVTSETGLELYDPLNVTDKTITAKIQNSYEVKTKSNPRREFAASVLSVGLIASNHCKLNQPAFSHYCIFTVSFPAEVMNDPEKDQRRLYLMPTQGWLSIIQVINYPTTSQRFVSQANYGETP